MKILESWLGNSRLQDWATELGLQDALADFLIRSTFFCILVLLAIVLHFLAKWLTRTFVHGIVRRTAFKWDDILIQHQVLARATHLIPATLLYQGSPVIFDVYATFATALSSTALVYMILAGLLTLDALLNAGLEIYGSFPFSRTMPLRSFVQVVKLILYLLGGIVIISIFVGKSPAVLIGGMGAMAAILMLIFKDPILGFVAGIQLSANRMLHLGDWIEMPRYGADGSVIDIALTTIKVQNWDKTISTIPTYALISDSFKNWRGMTESGGRRIKRSVCIDMSSIRFCDQETLDRFKRIRYIQEYIEQKIRDVNQHNKDLNIDESDLINARRLTNIGTFRAYISAYLRNHPRIHKELTFLVRHLEPTPQGLPIEIYVFSNDQVWANYEGIQADIFDHILAMVSLFDLKVFQYPSGYDLQDMARGLPSRS